MVSPNDIKKADKLLELGFLYEAKDFFSNLLMDTTDQVVERICENRLIFIRKKIGPAKECCMFNIESINEDNGFIICDLKISSKLHHVTPLINDIFKNSHKKNYPDTSKILISQPATQTTCIEISGYGADERCQWCLVFRKNLIYYLGKKRILRAGHCPLGKEIN